MRRLALATLFALTCAIPTAQAATIQININVLLDGSPVSGDQTVATLLFEDVEPNKVKLTVTSSLNAANEFVRDIGFNVHSDFTPSAIVASFVSGSKVGSFELPTLTSTAQNAQDPTGASSGYDHQYAFSTSNSGGGADRFNLSDSFQYFFTANGLDALDFSVPNAAGYYAFAHIQGMTAGSGSYVATGDPNTPVVPEPTSLILLATGLIAGARTLRKRS
jgi:hypothetical protein